MIPRTTLSPAREPHATFDEPVAKRRKLDAAPEAPSDRVSWRDLPPELHGAIASRLIDMRDAEALRDFRASHRAARTLVDRRVSHVALGDARDFSAMAARFPHLRSVSLAHDPGDATALTAFVRDAARACPGLEALDLRGCESIDDTVLRAIGDATPKLRELAFGKDPGARGGFECDCTTDGLRELARSLPELTRLTVRGLTTHMKADMTAIGKGVWRLRHLDLRYPTEVAGEEKMIDDEDLALLAERQPSLRSLRLDDLRIDHAGESPTDRGARLARFARNLPQLEALHLTDVSFYPDDEAFGKFTEHLGNLRELIIVPSDITLVEIGNAGAAALARHAKKLRKLTLHTSGGLGDAGVEALVRDLPELESLDITGHGCTDAALHAMGTGLRRLRHLDLDGPWTESSITGDGLAAFEGHPALRSLGLGRWHFFPGCVRPIDERVGARLVERIAKLGSLERLSLSESPWLDDAGMARLTQALPRLTHADFRECEEVSDLSVDRLAMTLPRLEELRITVNHHGSPVARETVTRNFHSPHDFPALRRLVIRAYEKDRPYFDDVLTSLRPHLRVAYDNGEYMPSFSP